MLMSGKNVDHLEALHLGIVDCSCTFYMSHISLWSELFLLVQMVTSIILFNSTSSYLIQNIVSTSPFSDGERVKTTTAHSTLAHALWVADLYLPFACRISKYL